MSAPRPFVHVFFDGRALTLKRRPGARRLRADARCFQGTGVSGFAHVCALPDRDAALRYDEPEVQQARRDALAWWIPLLGESLISLTTLAVDASRFAGAITVVRDPRHLDADPFARLFAGTLVPSDAFAELAPPSGPAIERYSGAPWPGGRFGGPTPVAAALRPSDQLAG